MLKMMLLKISKPLGMAQKMNMYDFIKIEMYLIPMKKWNM